MSDLTPHLSITGMASSSRKSAYAVELKKVVKSFKTGEKSNVVLHDIDLQIPTGSMSFVVGPSGCGKTTLISIIAGILTADSGEINVLDNPIHRMSQRAKAKFRRNNVGFIFQQFNLISTISIAENVAVPLLIRGVNHEEAIEKACHWLDQVGLGDRPFSLPRDFSGGQQQRVAIARALVNDPKLIICDEPTSALDGKTGQIVMELLKEVSQKEDRAVVIVTHDNRIYRYADNLIDMEDGRIKHVAHDASAWAEEAAAMGDDALPATPSEDKDAQ
jgi:putative ABC transport system ATP-binding protein